MQNFRSEFFGRVREVLKDRSDVQIVGDRFIFQSEVLFAPGQASIGEAGQQQLSQIATALIEITTTIPADIPWLLQVDGHTDNIPIAGQYKDNWDLSTERALSVVRLMIEQGVPPQRLSAAGYGEFQPVSEGDTELDSQKTPNRVKTHSAPEFGIAMEGKQKWIACLHSLCIMFYNYDVSGASGAEFDLNHAIPVLQASHFEISEPLPNLGINIRTI